MLCPICLAEMVDAGEDRLDQSGRTWLPARRFTCPKCVDTVLTIATGEPYRSYPMVPEKE